MRSPFVNPVTGLPFTEKSMRYLKGRVEEICGVRFEIKDVRSTFCSLTISDHTGRPYAASEQMRHASPEMNRRHYARINRGSAVRNGIGDAWRETEIRGGPDGRRDRPDADEGAGTRRRANEPDPLL